MKIIGTMGSIKRRTRFGSPPIAILAAFLVSQPTAAQTSHEVVKYKGDTLKLVLQCPIDGTDYDANIAQCLPIKQKLKDRRAAATTNWRWADDRLQWRLMVLNGRIMGNYFKRDGGRSVGVCHHVEKSWLNLNWISVNGRTEIDKFFDTRATASKVVGLCRKERGTPEWGAPMALGEPSQKKQSVTK